MKKMTKSILCALLAVLLTFGMVGATADETTILSDVVSALSPANGTLCAMNDGSLNALVCRKMLGSATEQDEAVLTEDDALTLAFLTSYTLTPPTIEEAALICEKLDDIRENGADTEKLTALAAVTGMELITCTPEGAAEPLYALLDGKLTANGTVSPLLYCAIPEELWASIPALAALTAPDTAPVPTAVPTPVTTPAPTARPKAAAKPSARPCPTPTPCCATCWGYPNCPACAPTPCMPVAEVGYCGIRFIADYVPGWIPPCKPICKPDGKPCGYYYYVTPGSDLAPVPVPCATPRLLGESELPLWVHSSDGWRYVLKDHTYASGWLKIGKNTYYCDPSTNLRRTGWQEIDGKTYYFNRSTGIMVKGRQVIDGEVYYFSDEGVKLEEAPVLTGTLPEGEPILQEPAQEEPTQQQPAQEEPAPQEPAQEEPAPQAPAQEEPAQQQPAQEEPAQEEPAQQQPAQEEPAQQQPAQEEPAPQEPAQASTSGETPATPAENVPASEETSNPSYNDHIPGYPDNNTQNSEKYNTGSAGKIFRAA